MPIKFKRKRPLVPVVRKSTPDAFTSDGNLPTVYEGVPKNVIDKVLVYLKINLSLTDACDRVGINPSFFKALVDKDVGGLENAVKQAKLTPKVLHLKRIHKAEKNWQASAWFLERTDRDNYGKEITVNDNNKTKDKQKIKIGSKYIKF